MQFRRNSNYSGYNLNTYQPMNEQGHKRGCCHEHSLMWQDEIEHRLFFQVEPNGTIKLINEKKRTLDGSRIQGKKAPKMYRFNIFQSINGVINCTNITTLFNFNSMEITQNHVMEACEFSMKHIDSEYIGNIVANLDDNGLFCPLHLPNRLYRCTITNTNEIPLHVFKTYKKSIIQHPSIDNAPHMKFTTENKH